MATTDTRRLKALHEIATVDAELLTPAHRAWVRAVMERAGFACQDPEHDPARPRYGIRLYADHIIERRDDAEKRLDLANGMARCGSCHVRKTLRERQRRMKA